jgi:catechol 2,3-dioxygenase
MADHLVSEALYLSDPDGLGIEIYADRPRATWHYRDRELVMTTDPLDITSLIAAGRGETWDGAPTNTTMGHVHLHAGNLDDAEAFYHRPARLRVALRHSASARRTPSPAGGPHHSVASPK